ncbi:hypothetical protein BC830DRAFT_1098716 [Chytriomyces sp. MP71]|nr:hypothetical protein BC830DRAFT_1098716 [Chytriomyces sp. MP71]
MSEESEKGKTGRMTAETGLCGICGSNSAKYSCPRCLAPYCSLACYRDARHAQCSEAFYKDSIAQHLKARDSAASAYFVGAEASAPTNEVAERRSAMLEMLQRFEDEAAAAEDETLRVDEDEVLDRLRELDLDSMAPEAILALLPEVHRKAFEAQVTSGEILKSEALHEVIAEPWWTPLSPVLVSELSAASSAPTRDVPKIPHDVTSFSSLTRGAPHPTLPFNLVELLCVYTLVWRRFNGELEVELEDASTLALSLSLVVKDVPPVVTGSIPAGYESVDNAVVSVWDRVLRHSKFIINDSPTPDSISGYSAGSTKVLLATLFSDLKSLLEERAHAVAALSHMHFLFSSAADAISSYSASSGSKKILSLQDKELKKTYLRVARKFFFYTCFAADETALSSRTLNELILQTQAFSAQRETLDNRDAATTIDTDGARQAVKKGMERETQILVEEI